MYCWRTALLRRELLDTDAMITLNETQSDFATCTSEVRCAVKVFKLVIHMGLVLSLGLTKTFSSHFLPAILFLSFTVYKVLRRLTPPDYFCQCGVTGLNGEQKPAEPETDFECS